MAKEFNITPAHLFFMGEDKFIDFTILNITETECVDMSGLPLEWNMKKTDKAADPGILTKGIGSGLTIIGIFSAVIASNTQRVRLTFVPADTAGVKAGVAYRHSLKRKDVLNNNILAFGSITFLQATEH